MSRPQTFGYAVNQRIRRAVNLSMRFLTLSSTEVQLRLDCEPLERILIVRATFRLGDSILAAPAISWFRKRFPRARIDFLGAPISPALYRNLPLDNHFVITRHFPKAAWHYPLLLRRLRNEKYDLAIDVSGSGSAMASFLVGFSAARYRVGVRGKWDRHFNVRLARPAEKNKYRLLPCYLEALGLQCNDSVPAFVLSAAEHETGRSAVRALPGYKPESVTVGVFVGGRNSWNKRWPLKNFKEVIDALARQGLNVLAFVGPDEQDLIGHLREGLHCEVAVLYEPGPRKFAALVANCDLFVTCDSGPMHLACALGVRTVALFLHQNFDRWGPPAEVARIVYRPDGCSVDDVLTACFEELSAQMARRKPPEEISTRDLSKTAGRSAAR